MTEHANHLQELSRGFQLHGQFLHAEPVKTGHIHETYIATYDQGGTRVRYLHQKLNLSVFKDPAAVMQNMMRVTTHIRRQLEAGNTHDLTRRVLTVVPTRDGEALWQRDQEAWRTFVYIEGVKTCEVVQSPAQARQVGVAFGEFQKALVDLPGERLLEAIPDFHHTRKRFTALQQAIQNDRVNRAHGVQAEIAFALQHEPMVDVLLSALAQRTLPERITHNDTKFNNLLLDASTGQALCVVDLDTVMPGCALYDFGDMVRTTTSPTSEDERDLAQVELHLPLFQGLAEGYLHSAGAFLTQAERDLLAFSGKLITFEMGIRFLADFLNGDIYYRIHRPTQNLDRCRTQFKLIESIEQQEAAMQQCVEKLWNGQPCCDAQPA
jgi:aminoglycoside phosphotransferase (APT) family kinase protein